MNIGFITDTNILEKNSKELYKGSKYLDTTDLFTEYINSLKRSKLKSKDNVIYFMPDIIVEELYEQKKSLLNRKYDTLKEKYIELEFVLKGELPTHNIKELLDKEKEKYKEKYTILHLNYSEKVFYELVEDSLRKNPPFDKSSEGRKTDAGYKDALIWKTILYSKEIDKCDKLYLFSGDKIFSDNEEYLHNEFKKHHLETELIIKYVEPDEKKRQNSLEIMISENNLIETDIIKLYNPELILKSLKNIKYNYSEEIYYLDNEERKIILEDIIFSDLDESDFILNDVREENEEYKVILNLETYKYKTNIESDLSRVVSGKIILSFVPKEQEFELNSYELKNITIDSKIYDLKINYIFDKEIKNNFNKSLVKAFIDGMRLKELENKPMDLEKIYLICSILENIDKKSYNIMNNYDQRTIKNKYKNISIEKENKKKNEEDEDNKSAV